MPNRKLLDDERRMDRMNEYVFELCTELLVGYIGCTPLTVQGIASAVLNELNSVSCLKMKVVTRDDSRPFGDKRAGVLFL